MIVSLRLDNVVNVHIADDEFFTLRIESNHNVVLLKLSQEHISQLHACLSQLLQEQACAK